MKPALVILFFALLVIGCNRKTTKVLEVYNYKDSTRIKDSIRIKDSTHILQKDSVVIREAVNTGFEITPCDSNKIKPFAYTFNKGNIAVTVVMNAAGKLNVNIDISREEAYRQKILLEYQQHIKDSLQTIYKGTSTDIKKERQEKIVVTVYPWWLWLAVAVAILMVVLKYGMPVIKWLRK